MGTDDFPRQCIQDMARKDLFATMLYIQTHTPPNQRKTMRKWALEAVGVKA